MTISVIADETLYRNEENGYTVLSVHDGSARVCAVGYMPEVASGRSTAFTADRSGWSPSRSNSRRAERPSKDTFQAA